MATRVDVPAALDAFDDLAGWIAAPPSGRPMADAAGRAGQDFCDAWSSVPPWLKIDYFLPPGVKQRGLPDLLCKPYFDANNYDPPLFEPPYTGGQCNALYRGIGTVSYNRVFCNTGNVVPIVDEPWATEFNLQGPLGAVSARVVTPGACGSQIWGLFVQTATGERLLAQTLGFQNFQNDSGHSFTVQFQIAGGGPDNCGNPAPELRPGDNPAPTPPTPPTGFEPGFDPVFGRPFFFVPPVESPNTDPFDIYPPGAGDDGADGSGGGGSAPPAGGDESEGEGSGQGGGDNDFGDPPEGERWVGCEVRLLDVPEGTGIIPQSLPQTIYTATQGNARLRFDSGRNSGYDTPIAIKSESLWLWEPVRGASPAGVFVNLRPGLGYTVRPYSVPLEN